MSDRIGKAPAANSMATCGCLQATCSNAALTDSTASDPATSCSCGTASDTAATSVAYPAAASVDAQFAQPIGSSMCSLHVSAGTDAKHSGRPSALHGGECHAHAITSRTWLAGCAYSKKNPVRMSCPFMACAFSVTSHEAVCCAIKRGFRTQNLSSSPTTTAAKNQNAHEVCVLHMFALSRAEVCTAACRSTIAIARCCSKA